MKAIQIEVVESTNQKSVAMCLGLWCVLTNNSINQRVPKCNVRNRKLYRSGTSPRLLPAAHGYRLQLQVRGATLRSSPLRAPAQGQLKVSLGHAETRAGLSEVNLPIAISHGYLHQRLPSSVADTRPDATQGGSPRERIWSVS